MADYQIPSDTEIRELGKRVNQAAELAYTATGRPEAWMGGSVMEEDNGTPVGRTLDGLPEVTFVAYAGNANALYRWQPDNPLPMTLDALGALLAGSLSGQNGVQTWLKEGQTFDPSTGCWSMKGVHCTGTLKSGKLAGKPCKKFLGELTAPYRVCCPRCGTWNEKKGDAENSITPQLASAVTAPDPEDVRLFTIELEEVASRAEHGGGYIDKWYDCNLAKWLLQLIQKGDATENGRSDRRDGV